MHFQYIVGVLATIMIASGCSANILDSIKNSVSNGVNSVENALGINDAPSPAGSFLGAEAPVPMYSLNPDLASPYLNMKSLLQNSSGPIVFKTASAALHLFNASAADSSVTQNSLVVPLSNNTGTLLAAYSNMTIILSFNSSDEVYSELLTAGNSTTQEPSFLAPILNGTAALPRVMQPVEDLLSGNGSQSLSSVIANISNGVNPYRIVTTGFGAGGGIAQLVAIWAATQWTQTQTRCITFGSPPVMNNRAGFAFQQFVDLPYVWAYNGSTLVNTVLRTIDNNTNPTVNGDYTLDDYIQAIIDAGAYAQSNGTTVSSPGISYEVADSTASIPSAEGLFGAVPGTLKEISGVSAAPTPSYEFANQTLIAGLLNPAPAPQQPNPDCPLILCKVRGAIEAACGTYEVYPPGSTFVPTLVALQGSQIVSTQPYDTHVIIDWDAATRTAIFVWRGSITEQDWLQDTKLKLVNGSWLLSPAIAGIFPYVQTHLGFTEQFQEVTLQAANTSVNIFDILAIKMNGVPPEKVICTGHSLGAALASLCSVWASVQYPSADILSVTIGQPYTGNQGWVDLYRLTVGREYRIIHQLDIVPAIPPVKGYRHVGLGIWELNGQVQVRDRPAMTLDGLNWNDHSCYNYSNTLDVATAVTILANATAEVALPASMAQSS